MKYIFLLFILLGIFACNSTRDKLSPELQKVIDHYSQRPCDSLKLKAAFFLIENMRGHFSFDSSNLVIYRSALVTYDSLIRYREIHPELDLINKMDSVWKKKLQFHDINADIYNLPVQDDLNHISSKYLISNINRAFEAWKGNVYSANNVLFAEFCEYILPYRKQEGLCIEEWRNYFFDRNFQYVKSNPHMQIQQLVDSLLFRYSDFSHTYDIMPDYPYLKLSDLCISRRGECGTRCWFNAMLFSSLGIPVSIDFVPAWGNRNESHQWNALIYNGKTYPFESFWEENRWKYKKLYNNMSSDSLYGDFRLAKVYRYSYKIENDGPANDSRMSVNDIPPLFLNTKKKDVSAEYFKTSDIEVNLTNIPLNTQYAYLCVFSSDRIIPIQWGKIEHNKVIFKNMGKDIIYVPAYYKNGVLTPGGQAFHLDYSGRKDYLLPSHTTRNVVVKRKYPIYPFKREWAECLVGGKFQGANRSDFSDAIDLYTIRATPDLVLKNVNVNAANNYRYVRFLFAKEKYGNLSEIKFYSSVNGKQVLLSGKAICSKELTLDIMEKALDGQINTFILTYMPGKMTTYQWWVGLDFGIRKKIRAVGFCPRTDENNVLVGLNYELLYWNNGWKSLGTQTATTNELIYKNAPANAIFILKCINEGKEERIFTYKGGKQVWW